MLLISKFVASSSLLIDRLLECEYIYLDGPLGDRGVAIKARSKLKNDRESLNVSDGQLGGGRGQHWFHSRLYCRHSLRPRTLHCPRAHLELVVCRRLYNNNTSSYTTIVTFNNSIQVIIHQYKITD